MNAKLFATRPPDQRCLELAQALASVSALKASECLNLAQRVYDFQFTQHRPLKIPLKEGINTADFERVCIAAGIDVTYY